MTVPGPGGLIPGGLIVAPVRGGVTVATPAGGAPDGAVTTSKKLIPIHRMIAAAAANRKEKTSFPDATFPG